MKKLFLAAAFALAAFGAAAQTLPNVAMVFEPGQYPLGPALVFGASKGL